MLCVGELLALSGFLIIKPAANAMTSSIIKSISGIKKFDCFSVLLFILIPLYLPLSLAQSHTKTHMTCKTVDVREYIYIFIYNKLFFM